MTVQVSLALRTLCGLSTRQIARAFLEDERTTAQRLVRARRKITGAGIRFELPEKYALPERLASVLPTVALLFNEGYLATDGVALMRVEVSGHALTLTRALSV